jgi:hypothetical protein
MSAQKNFKYGTLEIRLIHTTTREQSFMRRFAIILAVSVFGLTGLAKAQERALIYYVQLIRGTDSDQPPQAGSKLVGAKLAGKLQCVFKWKNYWEINQRKIEVDPGRTARVHLGNGREVGIDLTVPGKRTVTAFQNGHLVDRTIRAVGEAMTLIGGDRDGKSVWFIVVRRDKPGG